MPTKYKNWMQYLSNDMNLRDLSIPGTHDSATSTVNFYTAPLAKTQDFGIKDQLDMGIRFMDIRLNLEEPVLRIFHGSANCNLTFVQFIDICKTFLAENKGETIIVSVKEEGNWSNFDNAVRAAITKDGDLWYKKENFPTLGDVRGKLVLIRRWNWLKHVPDFGIDASPTYWDPSKIPFYIAASKMCVQDDWDASATNFQTGIDQKIKSISDMLNLAQSNPSDGNFYLSFMSAHGGLWGESPEKIAKGKGGVKGILERTEAIIIPKAHGARIGTLLIDFAGSDNSNKIISSLISNNIVAVWPDASITRAGIQTNKFPSCCEYADTLHLIWASFDEKDKIWLSSSQNGADYSAPYNPEPSKRFLTKEGLGVCKFNKNLYMFWKANDYGNWIWHSYMNELGLWSEPKKINDIDTTNAGPSASVINNRLYVFWKANASGAKNWLYHSVMNQDGSFPAGTKINEVDQSDNTPRAVELNGTAHLFWKENSSNNRIWTATRKSNGGWNDGKPILDGDLTADPIAACVYDEKIYIFWRAYAHGDQIYFSESSDGVKWSKGVPTNATLHSPVGPGCGVFKDKIYIFCGRRIWFEDVLYSRAGSVA